MRNSVRIVETRSVGTTLFEEFEDLLPNFNNLTDEIDFLFIKAIALLVDDLQISQSILHNKVFSELEPVVRRLRERYAYYRNQNMVIACAIFIVAAHIESYYLNDQDAKLVHSLTKLYIDRARAG